MPFGPIFGTLVRLLWAHMTTVHTPILHKSVPDTLAGIKDPNKYTFMVETKYGQKWTRKMAKNGHLSKNRMAHSIGLGMPFPKMVLLLSLGQKWLKWPKMSFLANLDRQMEGNLRY